MAWYQCVTRAWFRKKVFPLIHIVDYGLGNVKAFLTIYKHLGITVIRAKAAADFTGDNKIILPLLHTN